MKYCSTCGRTLHDDAAICTSCGCVVGKIKTLGDSKSFAWTVVSFFFPLLGIILYLVWKDDRPLRSKSIKTGFMIPICIAVFVVVVMIIMFCLSMCAYQRTTIDPHMMPY